jgi:hypothetical protein
MTNTDILTEITHRLERIYALCNSGTYELARDNGSPPEVTFYKLVGRPDEFTDLP